MTNGYNIGVTKLIGDAFREESLARRGCTEGLKFFSNQTINSESEIEKLMLIGIVSTTNLKNAHLFKGTPVIYPHNVFFKRLFKYSFQNQELVSYKIEEDSNEPMFSLNPDHTHFILVDDDNINVNLLKFRVALEKRLQRPIPNRKLKRSTANLENMIHEEAKMTESSTQDKIPLVSLLIGGGIGSISVVLTKIYQGIPILVFKGTGHAPDLISGAYEDFADRFEIFSHYFL